VTVVASATPAVSVVANGVCHTLPVMQRYHAEHASGGKHVRHNPLVDSAGRPVLSLVAANGVANERGLPVLYFGPSSVLGTAIGAHEYTVYRARRPGMTMGGTPVATVLRPTATRPFELTLTVHEPVAGLGGARFAMGGVDPATLVGYANGLSDPATGVWDLIGADGRVIARHWARVGRDFLLEASDLDVFDESVPLAELVCVMLCRYAVWCPTRGQTGGWSF
jgi:hypothetical protein